MTKDKLRQTIGNNIRNIRLASGMCIDELSESLELTSGFVGLIERGQRGATAYTLYKLSEVFDIPVDSIFSNNLKLAEEPANEAKIKRNRVISLLHNLSSAELDYLTENIKSLRTLKNNLLGVSPNPEEEDDQDDFDDK